MVADRALTVFVECFRKPERAAIGQRTKTSIDVIKARIHKLDRNDKTAEQIRDCAVRIDVGAEFVAAEKNVAAEKRVAFALEVKVLREPDDFVVVLFHPTGEMGRFASALFVPEITWDETTTNR